MGKHRNIFQEILLVGHDEDFNPQPPERPTAEYPGSWEKVEVLCQRVRDGEALWHENDYVERVCDYEAHMACRSQVSQAVATAEKRKKKGAA